MKTLTFISILCLCALSLNAESNSSKSNIKEANLEALQSRGLPERGFRTGAVEINFQMVPCCIESVGTDFWAYDELGCIHYINK